MPADVCESCVPTLVYYDEEISGLSCVSSPGSMVPHTPLTPEQLDEIASVYNAWRVGNLQDCTIRVPGNIKL